MPTPLHVILEGCVRQAWRNVVLAFSYCEGGRGGEYNGGGEEEGRRYEGGEEIRRRGRGRDGRRLISEQLMSSCVHHTHLLFSEVDVGQSEVDCVQVGRTGDVVHCSLVTVLSRGEIPHQKVGVA